MKYLFLFLLFLCLSEDVLSQDVTFSLENPQVTNSGATYEVDVMISSSTGFKLGSGQLYLNYNPQAFGTDVARNNRLRVGQPAGSILATSIGPFGFYNNQVKNDNTTSRFSFAWQHAFSSGCLATDNVSPTPMLLLRLALDFLPGAEAQLPQVCFEMDNLFRGQTFTACGTDGSCDNANCQTDPGTQLTNDNFNCLDNILPVELVHFSAEEQENDAQLTWQTSSESGSSHFLVEKRTDASGWEAIGDIAAAGNREATSSYSFTDWDYAKTEVLATVFYYRLRMVDTDGSYAFSNVEAIRPQSTETGQGRLFPNPTSGGVFLTLESPLQEKGEVSIFNLTGKKVYGKILPPGGEDTRYLDLQQAGLAAGAYLVRVTEQGRELLAVQRLVVAPR